MPTDTKSAKQQAKRVSDVGRVKWFNETNGFGFITLDSGAGDVFLHVSALQRIGMETIAPNTHVRFEVDHRHIDQKKFAVNLTLLD